jgi:hypothetical protein
MRRLLNKYRELIHALSKRTGTPVSSLVTSFLILHEATAVIPFATTFFVAKSFKLGPSILSQAQSILVSTKVEQEEKTWLHKSLDRWTKEGQAWVEKVGHRYEVFGLETNDDERPQSSQLAGDVTNALAAYLITKVRLCIHVGIVCH